MEEASPATVEDWIEIVKNELYGSRKFSKDPFPYINRKQKCDAFQTPIAAFAVTCASATLPEPVLALSERFLELVGYGRRVSTMFVESEAEVLAVLYSRTALTFGACLLGLR